MAPQTPHPGTGHAAGNLDPDERRRLYTAALDDQDLFDQLLGDEPLREVLTDEATRVRLVHVIADAEPQRSWHALFATPWRSAVVVAGLAAIVAAVVIPRVIEPAQPGQQARSSSELPTPHAHVSSEPSRSGQVTASAVAALDAPTSDPVVLSIARALPPASSEATPKSLLDDVAGRYEIRFVPPRDGSASAVAVTASGESFSVYPAGAPSAPVTRGTAVEFSLPVRLGDADVVEVRVVIVDPGEPAEPLGQLVSEARAVVYAVRPQEKRR